MQGVGGRSGCGSEQVWVGAGVDRAGIERARVEAAHRAVVGRGGVGHSSSTRV